MCYAADETLRPTTLSELNLRTGRGGQRRRRSEAEAETAPGPVRPRRYEYGILATRAPVEWVVGLPETVAGAVRRRPCRRRGHTCSSGGRRHSRAIFLDGAVGPA